MVFAVVSGVGASGGRFVPANPTATHTAAGQFTISNYVSTQAYILSNTSTASRSGAIVTLSNTDDSTTVHAAPPKLGVTSVSPVYVERKAYTFNVPFSYFVQTGFQTGPAPCAPGWTCYGSCGPGGSCGRGTGYQQPACCLKDPTPSGYNDSFGEWARIT